jgi:hypothetical protein
MAPAGFAGRKGSFVKAKMLNGWLVGISASDYSSFREMTGVPIITVLRFEGGKYLINAASSTGRCNTT